MDYLEISFAPLSSDQKEVLAALLTALHFEGIQEEDTLLKGYILKKNFNENSLVRMLQSTTLTRELTFRCRELPTINWNLVWEQSYQPVTIARQVRIRASFHNPDPDYPLEILIDPQMSFGTGHHETTQLMITLMLDLSLQEKTVLDFGCGTGILSILAFKRGAKHITALDVDMWASLNTQSNFEKNNVRNAVVIQGSASGIPEKQFDIILANVNKNVIIQHMEMLACRLAQGGVILFSGLLKPDEQEVIQAAGKAGLLFQKKKIKKEWIALSFTKS
ncbi:MAG: ribosomal protein L11 methyltransferase [Chitinophagales bacterium]|nr:MAG: ribosomal protein L11 methyltransferase [Chitinophagales bacterium]